MSILKIKDENGNFIPIYTIKGDKGDPGNDYILTEEDKQEIAEKIKIPTPEIDIPEWAQQETKPTYTADEIGAVPIERKIAGIDLKDNITTNELRDALQAYPPVIMTREPETRETSIVGKVGQFGILTYAYNTKLKIYKCIDVSYTGNRYVYDWQCVNWLDGVYIDHTSDQFPENMNSGPDGTMVYKFNTKTLYFFNGSVWTEIPLNINLADSLDNATDDQIPTVKAVKSYVDNIVDSVNSALDEIHAYAQGIISGGVTE